MTKREFFCSNCTEKINKKHLNNPKKGDIFHPVIYEIETDIPKEYLKSPANTKYYPCPRCGILMELMDEEDDVTELDEEAEACEKALGYDKWLFDPGMLGIDKGKDEEKKE